MHQYPDPRPCHAMPVRCRPDTDHVRMRSARWIRKVRASKMQQPCRPSGTDAITHTMSKFGTVDDLNLHSMLKTSKNFKWLQFSYSRKKLNSSVNEMKGEKRPRYRCCSWKTGFGAQNWFPQREKGQPTRGNELSHALQIFHANNLPHFKAEYTIHSIVMAQMYKAFSGDRWSEWIEIIYEDPQVVRTRSNPFPHRFSS